MSMYLIDSNLKALRVGAFVKADTDTKEFIFDTEEGANIATMRGIAEANEITLASNLKKGQEICDALSTGLEGLDLPKMDKMAESDVVANIIKEGLAEDKTDDEMLVQIISSGITFKKAGRMFKVAMEKGGHRITTKDRQASVNEVLVKLQFNPDSYSDVHEAIVAVKAAIKDTEDRQALFCIRKYAKDHDIEMPKIVRKSKRAGLRSKIFKWIVANPSASNTDLVTEIKTLGKDDKFAKRYTILFDFARQVANATMEATTEPSTEAA